MVPPSRFTATVIALTTLFLASTVQVHQETWFSPPRGKQVPIRAKLGSASSVPNNVSLLNRLKRIEAMRKIPAVPEETVSRGASEPSVNAPEVRWMVVTAYTKHDKTMNGRGITASGAPVKEGVTIAAPPEIPFGTRIFIPALGRTYTVTDRGGAIRGDHLDLYMASRKRAIKFGRKRLRVVISFPKRG